MFLIQREDEDAAKLLEAESEARLKTAVLAADLPHGLKNYRALFEDEGEKGFTPQNEREYQKMMLEIRKLELSGEL